MPNPARRHIQHPASSMAWHKLFRHRQGGHERCAGVTGQSAGVPAPPGSGAPPPASGTMLGKTNSNTVY